MNLKRPFAYVITATLTLAACGGTPAATPKPSATPSAAPTTAPAQASVSAAPKPTPTTLPAVAADTSKVQLTTIQIPPLNGRPLLADILEVDPQAKVLYMADRTLNGIDVFDVSGKTAKYVSTIATGSPANGLVVAKNVNKLFTALSNSHVAVIDIDPSSQKRNQIIADMNTGGKNRANEVEYYSADKKVYVVNSDDQFMTVIDATKNEIIKRIDIPGGILEHPRFNSADGLLYLAGYQDNVIHQIDPKKDAVANSFRVVDECNPADLAINPGLQQALLSCNNRLKQHTAVWDFKTSKVTATFDQMGGSDVAIYNSKADRYFVAGFSFYRGPAMGIFGGSPIKFMTNVPTTKSSHAVAYDEANNLVYTEGETGLLAFAPPK